MPPTLTPLGSASTAARYSPYVSQLQSRPARMLSAGMSSTDSISSASQRSSPRFTGANVTPQLPSTTDVTPCQQEDVASGSQAICASRWVCTSTKPGVTYAPSASISRLPFASTVPTSTTRSPSIATSARRGGAPVPSTNVPPL